MRAMQTKAKEYLAAVDTKWRGKVDDLEKQVTALQAEANSLKAKEAAAASANANAGADEKRLRLERDSARTEVTGLREQLSVAQQERDAAMTVARSEKKRADDANAAREQAIRELRDAKSKADQVSAQHASIVSDLNGTIGGLRNDVAARQRSEADLRSQLSSAHNVADDRGLELATALSSLEASNNRVSHLEKQLSQLQQSVYAAEQSSRTLQRDLESGTRENEQQKFVIAQLNAREQTLRSQIDELTAKLNRTETGWKAEKGDWSMSRLRLEDALATRNAERDRLTAEIGRLNRQVDEAGVELRKAKGAVVDAEATATAARNQLTAAEGRALDAENRLSLLQNSLKSNDNVSGKLRLDHAAVQEELQRIKAELDASRTELQTSKAREAELASMLAEAQKRNSDLQTEMSSHKARADASEARMQTAHKEALDHQRKRLEAKTELVGVAGSLEKERAAFATLTSTLTTAMLPKLVALCGGLHNLVATLDPGYAREHSLNSSRAGDRDRSSSSFATEGSSSDDVTEHDIDLDAPIDSDGYNDHMRRFASRLKRSLEQGDRNASSGTSSPAAQLTAKINALLDSAQTSTYAATRAAVTVARQAQSNGGLANGGAGVNSGALNDGDPEPPSGPLALLTSCFLSLAPGHPPGGHPTRPPSSQQHVGPLGPSSAQTRHSSARRDGALGSSSSGGGGVLQTPTPNSRRAVVGTGIAILNSADAARLGHGHHQNRNARNVNTGSANNDGVHGRLFSMSDAALESVALTQHADDLHPPSPDGKPRYDGLRAPTGHAGHPAPGHGRRDVTI